MVTLTSYDPCDDPPSDRLRPEERLPSLREWLAEQGTTLLNKMALLFQEKAPVHRNG
jgi:hypothetical protein